MRRRTWVLLGSAAVVLVGAGVGAGVVAARYQPVESTSFELAPAGLPVDAGSPDMPEQGTQFPFRDGGVITYGLTVRNKGSWTVRITSVESPPSWFHVLMRPVAVRTDRPGRPLGYDDDSTVPFQPFDLRAGESRLLLVHLRMGDCQFFGPGVTQTLDNVVVHFSFLGFDHRAQLRLPFAIQVVAPDAGKCPGTAHSATIPTP